MTEDLKKRAPAPKKPEPTTQERKHVEELLDEALDETFPASDPPAMLEPAPDFEKTEGDGDDAIDRADRR